MRENRTLLTLICVGVAIAAVATAAFVFRNQIQDFVMEVKDRIEEKRCYRDKDFSDATCADER